MLYFYSPEREKQIIPRYIFCATSIPPPFLGFRLPVCIKISSIERIPLCLPWVRTGAFEARAFPRILRRRRLFSLVFLPWLVFLKFASTYSRPDYNGAHVLSGAAVHDIENSIYSDYYNRSTIRLPEISNSPAAAHRTHIDRSYQ